MARDAEFKVLSDEKNVLQEQLQERDVKQMSSQNSKSRLIDMLEILEQLNTMTELSG